MRASPRGDGQATASAQSSQTSQTQEHSRQTDACSATASRRSTRAAPPPPPLRLSPLLACDPATAPEVLWFIAEHEPELRRWLVANPSADAALLEYVAQAGGPGVNRALTILLDGLPAA